jgi:hypothetical protein
MRIRRQLGAALGATILTFGIGGAVLAGGQGDPNCGVEPLDVELIIDASGSMGDNSSNGKSRMEWAQQAAKALVGSLDANGGVGGSGHHVGLTAFSGSDAWVVLALGNSSKSDVNDAIDTLSPDGNTPLQEGMEAGAGDVAANGRGGATQIMILLSDGRPNPDQGPNGTWAASDFGQRPTSAEGGDYLGAADVRISVAFGEGGSGPHALDLALMALLGPDGAYHVVNGDELPDVFKDIYVAIACPATEPPVTEPPASEPPASEPPASEPPASEPPASEPPASEPPASEPPVTEPPVTEPPVTEPPVPSFEQSVGAETNEPTLPNTSAIDGPQSGPSADMTWLLVLALGTLLGGLVVLTPAPARRRR